MLRVFICYGKKEGEKIGNRVRRYLRTQGMDAFLASPRSPDIPAGVDRDTFIEQKLFSSHAVVPICDSEIHRSRPARGELRKAIEKGIPIVAFIRGKCRVPKEIKGKWVPIRFDPANPKSAYPRLMLMIYRTIDWKREQSEDLSLARPKSLPLFSELKRLLRRRI